jgi:glycosyltransferase involved in cell wall biosynthesis
MMNGERELRVLLLCPFFHPNVGGAETHLADLCQYLGMKGYGVQVICYQPLMTNVRAKPSEIWRRAEIRRISWIGRGLFYKFERFPLIEFAYLTPIMFLFTALSLMGPRPKPDIIHSHGLSATAAGVFLGKLFGVRTVASLHTIYRLRQRNPTFSKLVGLLLSRSSKVFVPSLSAKTELEAVGVPAERVEVYTYWVDQGLFRPLNRQKCRESIRISPKGLVILYVGRLIESKGVEPLIASAKRLPEHTFVFVGEGPLKDNVENAAREHPNIIFLGRKENGEELAEIYNCADMFWGTADKDYVGRVVIEALSCGVPVILPDRLKLFGIENEVEADLLGPAISILVKPFHAEIESRLRNLAENPAIIRTMSEDCRKFALSFYSDRNAAIIEKSYLGGDEKSQSRAQRH